MSCKNHLNIEDHHTGYLVCTCCGLVQDVVYQYDIDNYKSVVFEEPASIPTQFSIIIERLNLPKYLATNAEKLFNLLKDQKKLNRSIGNHAACVFVACEQDGSSRTFKELSIASGINKFEIGKQVKYIRNVFKLFPKIEKTENFMIRYCGKLGLTMEQEKKTIQMIDVVKPICNKTPLSIAAAVIYIVTNKTISMQEICCVFGISEYTLKETFKELYSYVLSGLIKV